MALLRKVKSASKPAPPFAIISSSAPLTENIDAFTDPATPSLNPTGSAVAPVS
jgi:hypothetical protein